MDYQAQTNLSASVDPDESEVTRPADWNVLSDNESRYKEQIHKKLLDVIDLARINTLSEEDARSQMRHICQQLFDEISLPINMQARQKIVQHIEDEVMGLGPLESLLADASISDILVNGPDLVYVERDGKLQKAHCRFDSEAHLRNVIDRIVSRVGRRIDESSPMVDARLKDGSRVNVVIPPLAIDGSALSIRRFAIKKLSIEQLIETDSLSHAAAKFIQGAVKGRMNILVSGGTGSGKTTFLNILSGFIPEDERVITIEDAAELQMQQPHVVRLETRPANIEGKSEITQRDLVKNALRMRPERIVIGEVRGGEAFDMLQAMNTGHDGSLTTIHANSARDSLTRVENMVAMGGIDFPISTIRKQIASAIHIVIQVQRLEDGKRKVVSIQEINGMEGDVVTMSELFKFERCGMDNGRVLGRFKATGIIPACFDNLQQRGIEISTAMFHPGEEWRPENGH
ncbi:MAG: pilus assembly protein CpaF [Moraxellaceae bacterium]|nr:MAG: pilus assembly protein CpaF [Moraxellaceae bacterium]